jgi:hypothetical protein
VAANDREFEKGGTLPQALLGARGFDPNTGARSGGITEPTIVEVPADAVLLRLYQNPIRELGRWWFTPHELRQIIDHFGRVGSAFAEGRQQGKGILHATLAVLQEWEDENLPTAGQLELFIVIQLQQPMKAYFGEGDVAVDKAQKKVLRPVMISDSQGHRRGVRQLFLPELWNYQTAFKKLRRGLSSDGDLIAAASAYGTRKLPFET